jgi:hypothetical protein
MSKAKVFSVPAPQANGYVWRWRCVDANVESDRAFSLYYDCVTDARGRGYEVEEQHAIGVTAPGGERHRLA